MRRPQTVVGLTWRLARLYPARACGIAAVAIAAIAFTAARRARAPEPAPCRFEQTWFTGDVHFSQDLAFHDDHTGAWTTGGMDSDAPHLRIDFQWKRDDATVTAVVDGEQRRAGYRLERRDWGCTLRFDRVFLPDDAQSLHYSDRR